MSMWLGLSFFTLQNFVLQNLGGQAFLWGCSSVVEHRPYKTAVAGSIPAIPISKTKTPPGRFLICAI